MKTDKIPQKSKTREELLAGFELVVRPAMEFLNQNFHPHVSIHINQTHATLSEDTFGIHTEDYIVD